MFKGPENFSLPENFTPEAVSKVRMELQNFLLLSELPTKEKTPEAQQERNDYGTEWIMKYAVTHIYTNVFNKYLEEHPTLLEDWEDIGKRDKIRDDIQERLEKTGAPPDPSEESIAA